MRAVTEQRLLPGTTSVEPEAPLELAAMRRLANGMANDFNNILQVISGNAENLLDELGTVDVRRATAQSIVDAARRASALTRQLQMIGQRRQLCLSDVDVSAMVAECLPDLRRQMNLNVRISTNLSSSLPMTRVDRTEIVEVILNLAAAANDSMPQGGSLKIATELVNVGPQMRQLRPWLRAGRYVRLEVVDSGKGLDQACLEHVFEPFYASAARCGSGLGLSAVYSAIKRVGGFIWVESELGQGSQITILLPVDGAARATTVTRDQGRVLLVEDDEGVRELLDGVLMHHGFSVASYPNAEEALLHDAPFDLIVTDAMLPGLSGASMARELKRRAPAVPVLLMSGDPGHADDIEGLMPRMFLQKPFSSQTLVASVRELLSP